MEKILSENKIIGVLGGMGPQATVEFYKLLIDKSISEYGAVKNDEFPEILIDSIPVPDFISNTKHMRQAKGMLIDRVSRMNKHPVSILGIACNTAHILLPELRKVSKSPIVSIMEEVKKLIGVNGYKRIGLLASIMTYKMGLYDGIEGSNMKIYRPSISEQQEIEIIIRGIIKGEKLSLLRKRLLSLSNEFIKKCKLDTIILGCTELPLVFPRINSVKVINTVEVLADSLLRYYYKGEKR